MVLKKGYTLMHEHTTIDLSKVKKDDDCILDCFVETVKEYKKLYSLGVRNIVDVTNIGMGRDISYIKKMSEETGINIISSTGFYKEPFLPDFVAKMSEQELADLMIGEILQGIDGFNIKANMIGEIGTSKDKMEETEEKIFKGAVLAHKKTMKPIYTHTTLGTFALEQANFFKEHNVDLSKVVIGHIDLCKDLDLILEVLKTGVNVGFDTIGKNNYFPDEKRVEFLLEIEKLGYINQVVLSVDLTRKSHLEHFGGIGYCYLLETFVPMLVKAGMKKESINKMLITNPERIMGN